MLAHPIICLMGPTAAGKTDAAIELAEHLPCDLISVDSAMVYRGMDIGTAKPSAEILAQCPHQLIDIRDPLEPYSAADFCQDAAYEIEQSLARERIPLLVGGTMLYFRALQQGLSALPSADIQLRERLTQEAEQWGWPALHQRLVDLDAVAALRIHPNDKQRIQRALEIIELTGKPLTELLAAQAEARARWRFINIAIAPANRALLHARIAKRFNDMLAHGFIKEVKILRARGDLHPGLPAIRAVGYRQIWEYLEKLIRFEEMQERGIISTRQLAKRQLTWLRSWPDVAWFDSEDNTLIRNILASLANKVML